MGLVDNDGVIAAEIRISREFSKQNAIGHHPNLCVCVDLIGKPHREPDLRTQRHPKLGGDSISNRARSYPTGLGMANEAGHTAARP